MNFLKNKNGGWLVPSRTKLPPNTNIPNFSEIGYECTIGDHSIIGGYVSFGKRCHIGPNSTVGSHVEFGDSCVIREYCTIDNCVEFRNHCRIFHSTKIGKSALIGNDVSIGDNCIIDECSELGCGCYIGEGCIIGHRIVAIGDMVNICANVSMEGVIVQKIMTLANVDGSGRQVIVIKHKDGILIRAGCFAGDLTMFVKKATEEGKMKYVKMIQCACECLSE